MKKVGFIALLAGALIIASCGTAKKATSPTPGEVTQTETVEGTTVNSAPWKQFGFANGEGYSHGEIKEVPFVYFTGNGTSANLRIAEEMARSAAYALVTNTFSIKNLEQMATDAKSGIVDNTSDDEATRVTAASEEFVRYAAQFSSGTLKGFTPFGETVIQFNEESRLYTVWARVGMPAKNWEKMYKTLADYKPKELSAKELKAFANIQKDVLSTIFQVEDDDAE